MKKRTFIRYGCFATLAFAVILLFYSYVNYGRMLTDLQARNGLIHVISHCASKSAEVDQLPPTELSKLSEWLGEAIAEKLREDPRSAPVLMGVDYAGYPLIVESPDDQSWGLISVGINGIYEQGKGDDFGLRIRKGTLLIERINGEN